MGKFSTYTQSVQVNSNSRGSKTPWIVIVGCAGILMIVCLCCAPLSIFTFSDYFEHLPKQNSIADTPKRGSQYVMALAVNVDRPLPRLYSYIGDVANDHWNLPAGNYYIEATDREKAYYPLGRKTIEKGQNDLDLGRYIVPEVGQNHPQQNREILLITKLVVGISHGEMAYLSTSSNGFTKPLFQSDGDWTPSQLEELYESYATVFLEEKDTIAALQSLEKRVDNYSSFSHPPGLSRPVNGVLSTLIGFFSEARNVDNRAVDDILQGAGAMSAEEKASAFHFLTPAMTGNSKSFDEMLQKLKDGEITNQANRIRSFLCDEESFYNALQKNRKTNRPLLEIAHEEGALLVEKGADLEVEIIKNVLQTAFPGIEQGFGYADKVNKWAELVRTFYNDPLAGAQNITGGYANDHITEQIKHSLLEMGLDESAADEMSASLTVEILSQLTQHDEELEELAKTETQKAVTATTEDVEEETTATPRRTSTSAEKKKTTTPSVAPTEENAPPKCDATGYIKVISGQIIHDDTGGCVYQAMVSNSHPTKNIYLAMRLTNGNIGTYKIDANKTWGTPFNMNAGSKNYTTDWYTAIFDTPECLDYYRGMNIDDYPGTGLKVVDANFPTCGN